MDKYDVGVIVGRFQLDDLHPAHLELINTVRESHSITVIVLGLSPLEGTVKNPLDFRTRKPMIIEQYPDVEVLYIHDMQYNDEWSKKLDNEVIKIVKRNGLSVCLYGGRDSFINSYEGKYPTKELTLQQSEFISSTARRKEITLSVVNKADFRKGIIYQSSTYGGRSIQYTVGVVFDNSYTKVLMCKRVGDRDFTFVTDKVEVGDTLEQSVRKTVVRKLAVEPTDFKYQTSMIVPEWIYRGEDDQALASIFTTTVMFGRAEAKDDLQLVKWVDVADLPKLRVNEAHRQIADMVYKWQY